MVNKPPSEKLKDWVSGRIKNNIIGELQLGKIINEDIYKNEIKFLSIMLKKLAF
jgi:hypothetical protein